MTETEFGKKIRNVLDYSFKIHGGAYQTPGIPDIIGFLNQWTLFLELKVNKLKRISDKLSIGKELTAADIKLTKKQENTLKQIGRNVGISQRVRSGVLVYDERSSCIYFLVYEYPTMGRLNIKGWQIINWRDPELKDKIKEVLCLE